MVVGYELRQVLPYIIYLGKGLEEGNQLEEASIFGVIVPGEDGDGIFRVKSVRGWRIINDNRVLHRAAQ